MECIVSPLISVLYKEVQQAILNGLKRNLKFREYLERLARALEFLAPRIDEAERLDQQLASRGNGMDAIILFRRLDLVKLYDKLKMANELVGKCCELPRWNLWQRNTYCKRLLELENDLLWFMQLHTQTDVWLDIRRALQRTTELHNILKALQRLFDGSSDRSEGTNQEIVVDGMKEVEDGLAYFTNVLEAEKRMPPQRREPLCFMDAGPRMKYRLLEFSKSELKAATGSFGQRSLIYRGGSARVYKGHVHGMAVAIKHFSSKYPTDYEFKREVEVLSRVMHPNIVTLMGVCTAGRHEKHRGYLVLEWIPNGSLGDHLNGNGGRPPLHWRDRLRIAAEICSALLWLQTMKPWSVFHGDVKPHNVLLDHNLTSKLCDFELSHVSRDNEGCDGDRDVMYFRQGVVNGTVGYIDPFHVKERRYNSRSDLYGLGVLLLQMFTGVGSPFTFARLADEKWQRLFSVVGTSSHDQTRYQLPETVRTAQLAGKVEHLKDPSAKDWPMHHVLLLADFGLRCCEDDPGHRPSLETVWEAFQSYCN